MQTKIFFSIIGLLVVLAVYAGIQKSGGILPEASNESPVSEVIGNSDVVLGESSSGTLSGRILIGPICPVERTPSDPNCEPGPETYAAYKVSVYDNRGVHIDDLEPESGGYFSLVLPAGIYTINRAQAGIGASNLPKEVVILPGETTNIEITIDTGIR